MHQRCVIVELWVDSCGFIEVMQVHSLLCVYSACTSPAHSSRWANPNRPTDLARLYALRERRIQPPVQRTVQVGCSSGKHQKHPGQGSESCRPHTATHEGLCRTRKTESKISHTCFTVLCLTQLRGLWRLFDQPPPLRKLSIPARTPSRRRSDAKRRHARPLTYHCSLVSRKTRGLCNLKGNLVGVHVLSSPWWRVNPISL